MILNIFSCVTGHFLWRNYIQTLPIFNWVVYLLLRHTTLYVFWIASPYQIQFRGLSFHFLDSGFWHTHVFDFDKVQFIFLFVCFGVIFKKLLPNPRAQICVLTLPSTSLIVLAPTFWSLFHSELMFLHMVWGRGPHSFCCMCISNCLVNMFCKDCCIPTAWSSHTFQKSIDSKCKSLILDSQFWIHWSIYLSLYQYHIV